MENASRFIICCLVFILGLIWVIGCNRTPTGGGTNGNGPVEVWEIDLTIQPDTVLTGSGMGVVSCFLTINDTLSDGEQIYFRAYSEDYSNANITPGTVSDSNSATGTDPEVHYFPVNYAGETDTIYAVYYEDYPNDTLAWVWVTVNILHP